MKTWRKALRRLVKKDNLELSRKFPSVYYRLPPAELQTLTRLAWAEVKNKLTAVPRELLLGNTTGAVWSRTLMRAIA